jgi:phage terminase large subunit GpA-like protein
VAKMPRNPRGMWKCPHCGEWNDPESDECYVCLAIDSRAPNSTTKD